MTTTRRSAWPWWPCSIVASILLSGLIVTVGPRCGSGFLADREFDRLWVECDRLGGTAGFQDGPLNLSGNRANIHVDLSRTSVNDEQLRRLLQMTGFRRVESLGLADTRITDKGLKLLIERTSISTLDLSRTGVTDVGLETIAKMRGLIVLNLSGNPITDRGLDTLVVPSNPLSLRSVSLYDTKVTKAGAGRLEESLIQATVSINSGDDPFG